MQVAIRESFIYLIFCDIISSFKIQVAIKELFPYTIYDTVASFKIQDAIKELFPYTHHTRFEMQYMSYLFIRYIWYRSIIQDARSNKRVI